MTANTETVGLIQNKLIVNNVEILENTVKKWKLEYIKIKRESVEKRDKKKVVYASEIEKFLNEEEKEFLPDNTEEHEKDLKDIESLLKVVEGKQQKLRRLNEALLETVHEKVDQIMQTTICNDDILFIS